MDREDLARARADRVEARTEDDPPRARCVVLEPFGLAAARDQDTVAMQFAAAMIQLDAAEPIAAGEVPIARQIREMED